jgi:curved DNA-binding protein CbpA
METLYDVLGVRPDDDAESLKNAYRKAVKANHPDRHASDPDAAERFRRIVVAYDILRDAKLRAAYDRLLERQRGPLHAQALRAIAKPAYQFGFNAIAGVVLGVVLAAGSYLLFAIHGTTGDDAGGMTAGHPPAVAAEPAPQAETAKGQAPSHEPPRAPRMPVVVLQAAAVSAAESKGAGEGARGPSAPHAAGQTTGRSPHLIDPTGPKAAAEDPGGDHEAEPAEQPQSTEAKTTALSQDEICKRDAAQLAQLRVSQKRDEVIRFERELGCEKLRLQVIRLRESVDPQ